jgi:hypothetical protein
MFLHLRQLRDLYLNTSFVSLYISANLCSTMLLAVAHVLLVYEFALQIEEHAVSDILISSIFKYQHALPTTQQKCCSNQVVSVLLHKVGQYDNQPSPSLTLTHTSLKVPLSHRRSVSSNVTWKA